jgi:hypothetical protein
MVWMMQQLGLKMLCAKSTSDDTTKSKNMQKIKIKKGGFLH